MLLSTPQAQQIRVQCLTPLAETSVREHGGLGSPCRYERFTMFISRRNPWSLLVPAVEKRSREACHDGARHFEHVVAPTLPSFRNGQPSIIDVQAPDESARVADEQLAVIAQREPCQTKARLKRRQGAPPEDLGTLRAKISKKRGIGSEAAEAVVQNQYLNATLTGSPQRLKEAAPNRVGIEPVHFDPDSPLRLSDRLQHARERLLTILQQADGVAFDEVFDEPARAKPTSQTLDLLHEGVMANRRRP